MDLITIGEQPDGFCPPEVSAKIVKVWDRKSGTNETGDWSFQNVDVEQNGVKATLKLKNLPQFPTTREGQSVTVRAHKSDKHGLIGVKTETREYNGKNYKSIVITPSAKWDWGSNGQVTQPETTQNNGHSQTGNVDAYTGHILACAVLANQVAGVVMIDDNAAVQACFATVVIDTKNRNILLPKPSDIPTLSEPKHEPQGRGEEQEYDDPNDPDHIPF
jgi:hypothetical protein